MCLLDFLVQDKKFVQSVLEKINPDNLRSFLKTLSKEPHLADSERDRYSERWGEGRKQVQGEGGKTGTGRVGKTGTGSG